MEEKIVLRAEGLVKRYGKRTVVNDVTFDVKQGEIVGLLGPNGAGKTTSFYMTTGLVLPNGGHIYLGDHEVTSYPVYKRARAGIGYLAQEASVFRKMSVEDNILSVLEMTGKPREEQIEVLEGLIADFRLEKVRKNKGLKDRNIGILITDHNVEDTLCITDRAYLLFEGHILFQGTPEELAANQVVRKNYLTESFVLRQKDFQKIEEDRKAQEQEKGTATKVK